MYARVTRVQIDPADFDTAMHRFGENVNQKVMGPGFKGAQLLIDPDTFSVMILSFFESREHARETEPGGPRDIFRHFQDLAVAGVEIGHYEVLSNMQAHG